MLASGQLGMCIDPSSTTMVQTGLVNSLAPQVASYLDIGKVALSYGIKLKLMITQHKNRLLQT